MADEIHIAVDLPLHIIQVLRLVHALGEAGCRLHVAPTDASKLAELERIFGLQYEVGIGATPLLPGLSIDHMVPETRVGSIARPLIFPRAVFDYCRTRWPATRPVRASFAGLNTPARWQTINAWAERSQLRLRMPKPRSAAAYRRLQRLVGKVARRVGLHSRQLRIDEGVKLLLSDEGRVSPHKSWNVEYYALLLESEHVLCPDGDFGGNGIAWTYRFFESILCGALPVVQNACPAYEGFRYRRLDQPLSAMVWSLDDAQYNFDLALERLTVPADALRREVGRLLSERAVEQASSRISTMRLVP